MPVSPNPHSPNDIMQSTKTLCGSRLPQGFYASGRKMEQPIWPTPSPSFWRADADTTSSVALGTHPCSAVPSVALSGIAPTPPLPGRTLHPRIDKSVSSRDELSYHSRGPFKRTRYRLADNLGRD